MDLGPNAAFIVGAYSVAISGGSASFCPTSKRVV
jgi:hypothetical protein